MESIQGSSNTPKYGHDLLKTALPSCEGNQLFPYYVPDKISCTENLIQHQPQIGNLDIINRHPYASVRRQQLMQQLQTWIHHAEPLVMTGEVFALLADNLLQPLLHARIIDVVVINPPLITGVIGRINIDALYPPLELGEQSLQRFKVHHE